MNYFVSETINGDPTAGPKARNDISAILTQIGWTPLYLNFIFNDKLETLNSRGFFQKARDNITLSAEWKKTLKLVGSGDTVLIQFPVLRRPIALATAIKAVKRRGGRIVYLIHDLELLRYNKRNDVGLLKKIRITIQEKSILKLGNSLIVHNNKMLNYLKNSEIVTGDMISLGIFDYLIPNYIKHNRTLSNSIAIAGNLRAYKSKYLLQLPDNSCFNLYGVGYKELNRNNIKYFGAFSPEELPNIMEASFGLVWDGDSADSCTGVTGEYLRINNPHKTSLYLSSGLPVIIWKEAALAEYILENECGIVVNSLDEIATKIKELNEEEYQKMYHNAIMLSEKLRTGYYTKRALSKIN